MTLETECIGCVKKVEDFLEGFVKDFESQVQVLIAEDREALDLEEENELPRNFQFIAICYLTSRFIEEKYPLWYSSMKKSGEDYFCKGFMQAAFPYVDKNKLEQNRVSSGGSIPVMPVYTKYVPSVKELFSEHTIAFDNCKQGNVKPLLQLAANIRRWGHKYQQSILKIEGTFGRSKIDMYQRVISILTMLDKISPLAYSALTDPQFLMETLQGSLDRDFDHKEQRVNDEFRTFKRLYSARDVCFQGLVAVVKACQAVLESVDIELDVEETTNEASRQALDDVFEGFAGALNSLPFLGLVSSLVSSSVKAIYNVRVVSKEREFRSRIAKMKGRLFMMFLDIDAIIEYKDAAILQLSKSKDFRKRCIVCAILDLFCARPDASECNAAAGQFFERLFLRRPNLEEIQCPYTRDRGVGLMADTEPAGSRMRSLVMKALPFVMPFLVEGGLGVLGKFLESDYLKEKVPILDEEDWKMKSGAERDREEKEKLKEKWDEWQKQESNQRKVESKEWFEEWRIEQERSKGGGSTTSLEEEGSYPSPPPSSFYKRTVLDRFLKSAKKHNLEKSKESLAERHGRNAPAEMVDVDPDVIPMSGEDRNI